VTADKVLSIGAAIVTVALVTTVVSHPASAQIITSIGNSFVNAIKAAQGR